MDEAERNIVIRSVILICETLTNHDILLAITEFSNCLINRSPSFFQGSDLPFFTRERGFNYAWAEQLQQNTFRRYYAWADHYLQAVIFRSRVGLGQWKERKKMHRMIKNIGCLSSLLNKRVSHPRQGATRLHLLDLFLSSITRSHPPLPVVSVLGAPRTKATIIIPALHGMSLANWRKSRLVRSWVKLAWFVYKWAHTLNIVYTAWEKYRVNLFLSGLEVKKTKTNLILLLTFNLPLLWLPPAPWANPSRSHLVTLIPR